MSRLDDANSRDKRTGPGDPQAAAPGRAAPRRLSRRTWLAATGAALGVGAGAGLLLRRNERGRRAAVAVLRADAYDGRLVELLRQGLAEIGVGRSEIAGRSVLLKPNLVEPARQNPQINTHPMLVRAVAELMRGLGASTVLVGEGPGHYRDTQLVLEESGLGEILDEDKLPFVDLNLDEPVALPNRLGFCKLPRIHLARTVKSCDLVVSMPKLKTHHWAGVTLSLKNLFGTVPGAVYGWPKNVLHQVGISPAILDISAAVGAQLAIVDGIVGMEGDGPIMGEAVASGVLLLGRNLTAVDATATRLMGIDPFSVDYLRVASGHLGPIRACNIEQRGERLAGLMRRFRVVEHPSLARLRYL